MRTSYKTLLATAAILSASSPAAFAADWVDIWSEIDNNQTTNQEVLQNLDFNVDLAHDELNLQGVAVANDATINLPGGAEITNEQVFGHNVISNVDVGVGYAAEDVAVTNVAVGSQINANLTGAKLVEFNNSQTFEANPTQDCSSGTCVTPPPPPMPPRPRDPLADTTITIDQLDGSLTATNLASNNRATLNAPGAALWVDSNQVADAITQSNLTVDVGTAVGAVNLTSAAIGNSITLSNVDLPDTDVDLP